MKSIKDFTSIESGNVTEQGIVQSTIARQNSRFRIKPETRAFDRNMRNSIVSRFVRFRHSYLSYDPVISLIFLPGTCLQ